MNRNAGTPPASERTQQIVTDRLLAAQEEGGEKLTFEWRGTPIHRFVITMPIELLYYNPDTHRIRAQRSLDPAQDAVLSAAPWSPDAQNYLDRLLKSQPSSPSKIDPEFEALSDNLAEHGQLQPGLITPDGVLVNGNTRCAALRALGKAYIRVAVLPSDSTRADVSAVELSLQLRKENKRDYSYINQLIAIEEQISRGVNPEEVMRKFHIRAKTLAQDQWVYALIQEAIGRSRSDNGVSLRLVDFEDHQEKLRELYRAYISEQATNQDSAEALKESRLALIMLGFAKTDVRIAKPNFLEKYLSQKLPNGTLSAMKPSEEGLTIPGLSVQVPDDLPTVKQARELTNKVLRARSATRPNQVLNAPAPPQAAQFLETVLSSANKALESAGRDERLRQRKIAAADRISDAKDAIELAAGDIAQALASKSLDEELLDESLTSLRGSLLALARQVQRSVSAPGEGATWLLSLEGDELG